MRAAEAVAASALSRFALEACKCRSRGKYMEPREPSGGFGCIGDFGCIVRHSARHGEAKLCLPMCFCSVQPTWTH
jgi:hypothetical protein